MLSIKADSSAIHKKHPRVKQYCSGSQSHVFSAALAGDWTPSVRL